MSDKKKTVVLGASPNPDRYSYLAVSRLTAKGHPVVAIGARDAQIGDTPVTKEHPVVSDVDTVTLYMNPARQQEYYDYILQLHPKRIIFNPGAENDELAALASSKGIEPVEACTLVLLSTGQY
ncbi:CoA-binding protein [Chitinophaga agri]|uniref:CoA-binding protein n=1 Tax=Chitinophaga agri TaxID=2703787 RepID=A0A6B9ZFG7_9BACT|nr:CoA-binding protein [Chitinophaga agri]QHS60796.1 CoA-binding protein [Chitinophaga agri]